MSVDLEGNDGFGLSVDVAGDDGIGAGKVQFDARDGQTVDGAVTFPDELVGVVVVIGLLNKKISNINLTSV